MINPTRLMTLLLPLALLASCGGQQKAAAPERPIVILDTDVGNDIDDVLAMQMLFNYEKAGAIDFAGITIGKCNPYSIRYVDGYARLNGRGDIPLGYAYDGVTPEDHKYLRPTLDTLIDGAHILLPERSIADGLPEGHLLLRKLLAGAPDNSVVLLAIGPETNLGRFIDSGPDEFSPLTGVELAAQKVRLLSVMGGLYNKDFDFPEWNILMDIPAAQAVFSKWPGELVTSGFEVGSKLLYPHQSILNDFTDGYKHPLCVSYKLYDKMPYDRQTWDLTSVLYAVEPEAGHFDLSPRGTITIDSLGNSLFAPSPDGKHRYLIIPDAKHDATLQALVDRTTGKKMK